ncbi:MAG: DUF2127 domain-containing protein [Thermodesulfobacteriota bacterium]
MKKSPLFLRLIILYKVLMGTGELIVSITFLRLTEKNLGVIFTHVARWLSLNPESFILDFIITRAGMVETHVVVGATLVILLFGVLNLIESYGLYNARRWGEWLTVIGTSALIPFEFYEVVIKFSYTRVWVLVANSVIVYYLAKHRELFHGKEKVSLEGGT